MSRFFRWWEIKYKISISGPWVPVVDSYASDPFLPDKPETLHRQNKINQVPMIIGRTEAEGILWTSRLATDAQFKSKFIDNWSTCGPINILGKESANITESDQRFVNNLVTNYNGGEVTDIQPHHLQDILTDAMFGLDTHKVARHLVNTGNKAVYKYYFSYSGKLKASQISLSVLSSHTSHYCYRHHITVWPVSVAGMACVPIPGLQSYQDSLPGSSPPSRRLSRRWAALHLRDGPRHERHPQPRGRGREPRHGQDVDRVCSDWASGQWGLVTGIRGHWPRVFCNWHQHENGIGKQSRQT